MEIMKLQGYKENLEPSDEISHTFIQAKKNQ